MGIFVLLQQPQESDIQMNQMTAGQFRNYQYNEVKKFTFVMACFFLLLAIGFTVFSITDGQLLPFLIVAKTYGAAMLSFFFLACTITLWCVYFAAKEQANNKHWLPTENGPEYDFRTKGVANE